MLKKGVKLNSEDFIKHQQFSWKISLKFFNEIEQHLAELQNHRNQKILKKTWLLEVIKKKIKNSKIPLNTTQRICFKIDALTNLKIAKQINEIRKIKEGYTKKQWILEAIEEQLSIEEEEIKQKFIEHRQLLIELKDLQ